jgi:hypothetical protein
MSLTSLEWVNQPNTRIIHFKCQWHTTSTVLLCSLTIPPENMLISRCSNRSNHPD